MGEGLRSQALGLVESTVGALSPPDEASEAARSLELDLEDLITLRGWLDNIISSARYVKKALDERIAGELGPHGAVRFGDLIYRAEPAKHFKVTNPDGLVDFLGKDWSACINVSYVKIGALKKLAESRGLTASAAVDSFGEYIEKDDSLQVLPLEKSPKFLQKLESGQRSFPKPQGIEEVSAKA